MKEVKAMRLMSNKILKDLQNLIDSNLEVQTGYKAAAERVDNQNLKEVFIIYIQKKSEYISELKRAAKELFGDQTDNFPLERFTISISGDNANSVLKRCETLEGKSLKKYKAILNDEVPSGIREIIIKQHNEIKEAKLHLKSLQDKF